MPKEEKTSDRTARITVSGEGAGMKNLIVIQADKLVKKPLGFCRIVRCRNSRSAEWREQQGKQRYSQGSSVHGLILRYLISKGELGVTLLAEELELDTASRHAAV
jgi:hypothetical protein